MLSKERIELTRTVFRKGEEHMYFSLKSIGRTGFLLVNVILLWTLCCPVLAQEDDTISVVDVVGSGAIHGNDMASAKEQAILNALVSAVATVAAEFQPFQQQVDKFKLFNELLYSQTDHFIKGYKVLTEYLSGKNYRAIVQATVMKDRIRETLLSANLVMQEHVMPRVLFFLAEKKMEDILPVYWWGEDLVFVVPLSEEAMAQTLKDAGMTVINHAVIVEPVNYRLDIPLQDAIDLGKHMAADIVIIGTAIAKKTTNVMDGNVKTFKGSVTTKAYRTETGKEIAFAARTAVFASEDDEKGGREALFNAGMLVGQEMILQLSSAWESESSQQSLVEISIHGTRELANFIKFRKALGKIPGVTAIHIKVMKADESTISVDYEGTAQSLADELLLKTFESFGIDIYEVSPGHVGIELIVG
jgi:hypothetical protein